MTLLVRKISIVIPVYNSAKIFPKLYISINSASKDFQYDWECILVDDQSQDNSWKVINDTIMGNSHYRAVQLQKNSGQQSALFCGFEQASGDIIITMDDDLQHSPNEIPEMVRSLENHAGWDVVMGIPIVKKHSFYRVAGSNLLSFLDGVINSKPPHVKLSAFRAIRKNLLDSILKHRMSKPVINALICQQTRNIGTIQVPHHLRYMGKSQYDFKSLLLLFFRHLFGFSVLPLKLLSISGILISSLAFFYGINIIIRKFLGLIDQPGFASIVTLIVFFGGLNLFSFGILGEYLLRIIKDSNRQPAYHIREIVNGADFEKKGELGA